MMKTLPIFSHSNRKGFSLVELSIVLVILGLIMGAILVGKYMIRETRLKKMIGQRDTYVSAVVAFQERFNALPGDFDKATTMWGAAHATPATCRTTESVDMKTCDGDGDNQIDSNYESFRVWQHLANAELIEGVYNGVDDLPKMPLDSSYEWQIFWVGTASGDALLFNGTYNHILRSHSSPLMPSEQYGLDTKLDDGKPAQGRIVGTLTDSLGQLGCVIKADQSGYAAATDLDAIYSLADEHTCYFYQRDFIGR